MTDAALVEAAELEPALWGALDSVRVFARMSPQGKAQVIRQLHLPYDPPASPLHLPYISRR